MPTHGKHTASGSNNSGTSISTKKAKLNPNTVLDALRWTKNDSQSLNSMPVKSKGKDSKPI